MKKLLVALTCLSLTACGVLWEYRGLEEIPQMNWQKADSKTFQANMSAAGNYDVKILFRHVYGFPYRDVAIKMTMTNPQGESTSETYTIPIINDKKEYLGEGSVDIWDVAYTALPSYKMEAGEYTFELSHEMAKDELELVMEVGVQIEKPEK